MARMPSGMRKKENGLFEKRFTVNGKRYSAYGHSVKECSENEMQMRDDIRAGLYNSNRNVTLDYYFGEWEKTRIGIVKESTAKIVRSRYENHIKPVLGMKKVQKIEKREIAKLQQDLSKKLCATTTNSIIVVLKSVLNGAVEDEIITKNPALTIKPLRTDGQSKASETIHRALTREEQKAFMEEARTEWLYEFFCFSLCTGMRINEITALKWSDIDYINNVIHVTKTISWKKGGGIAETPPKSNTSKRDIPMNDTIKKILKMQREKISMVYGEIFSRQMDNNVFIGSNGTKAIASSTVGYSIKSVLKRLKEQGIEIEYFSHHAFRDTFATRYIEEGGNMQTLKKILGHSSLAMTADLYSHVLPDTKQQEMKQIENGFAGVAVL
ncbi:MAG: site-specific integrase [Blautia sp.]|nr:site-specific integrase [Blautia sp.]